MMHGMVIVGQVLAGGELVVTCLCGWFGAETPMKVDMAAMLWRKHHEDVMFPQMVVEQ